VLIDGRYQHSPAYIHDVTSAEGLQIIAQKDLNSLVDNASMPLKTVYIIKKMTLH
jgi:predicted TPR repeat methyltransferase